MQNNQEKIDRLQTQIRRFQTDLEGTQEELRDKIKSLENVQIHHQSDLHQQLKNLTEQLNNERSINTKLNADLAKSLEVGLQLQLEIQSVKARTQQVQHEERKYSQTLQEKIRQITHELDLTKALHAEAENEFAKARARFQEELKSLESKNALLDEELKASKNELSQMVHQFEQLEEQMKQKSEEAAFLAQEVEKMSSSFSEVEESSVKHYEAFKNLSTVAENKIVELKIALDRKTAECRDFEGHLHQAVTQSQLLKQENANLKDYIAKINVYLQQSSSAPVPPAGAEAKPSSPPPAPASV